LPRRHNDTHSVCHNDTLPGPHDSVTGRPDARSRASAQQNESHHPPRMNGVLLAGWATPRPPPPFPCLRPRRELVSGVARCSCNEYY
jgi:hypothetical protein